MLNGVLDWITRLIGHHGFPAVLGLMTLESACIPVPSEVIQLFAGYLVSAHRMTLFAPVSAGVLGNVIGSWISWSVGQGAPPPRAACGRVVRREDGVEVHGAPRPLEAGQFGAARAASRRPVM